MKFIAGWFTKSCQIAGASPRAQAQQCRITCEMTGAMALGKSKLSSRHSELKTKMGRFSNSLDGPPAPFPQSFDLDVLRRRIKEVRRETTSALRDACSICAIPFKRRESCPILRSSRMHLRIFLKHEQWPNSWMK